MCEKCIVVQCQDVGAFSYNAQLIEHTVHFIRVPHMSLVMEVHIYNLADIFINASSIFQVYTKSCVHQIHLYTISCVHKIHVYTNLCVYKFMCTQNSCVHKIHVHTKSTIMQ